MTDFAGVPFGFAPNVCPACGAEDGNCGPLDGSADHPAHVLFQEWGREYVPPTERTPSMNDVVATDRIFEKVPIPRTQRTSKVLRFRPGQVIPAEDARRLGVGTDGTQKSVPTAEETSTPVVPLAAKASAKKAKAAPKKAPAKKAAKKTAKAAKKA